MPPRETPAGHVLLIADDRATAASLERWIAAAGEQPVVVAGAEHRLLATGDDESVDLVVTHLDTGDPVARGVLDRLLGADLFPGVPQLHVLRDLDLLHEVSARRILPGVQALPHPAARDEFQARVRLAAELGRLQKDRDRSSIRDPITGLFNRRYLLFRLGEEFSRARRYRSPLSLVLIDVDRLKRVNDAFGQTAGDAVLRKVSQLVNAQVRMEDLVGRMGEDVFAVVLPGNRYRGAAILASKIRTGVEELVFPFEGDGWDVRVSGGIATYPDNPAIASADDLMRTTENALSEAKARGGNRIFIDEAVLRRERKTVLVVDPDPTLLDLAEDLLALDDLRVLRALDAAAAFDAIRHGKPDLVVLNLATAGSDGDARLLDAIGELHARGGVPVIGLSSDPDADPEAYTRLGVDRFITKPFSLSLLRSLARELLEAQPTA